MKEEIRNIDNQGRLHGYQQLYWLYKLTVRGNSKHDEDIGYQEYHDKNTTEFHIK